MQHLRQSQVAEDKGRERPEIPRIGKSLVTEYLNRHDSKYVPGDTGLVPRRKAIKGERDIRWLIAKDRWAEDLPAPVAQVKAEKVYKHLWGNAKHLYPRGVKRPVVHMVGAKKVPAEAKEKSWRGWQPSDSTDVYLAPSNWRELLQKNPDAMKTVLHEWAHSFQSPRLAERHTRTEGGAEKFAQFAAKRLGLENVGKSYLSEVKRIRRRKSKRWIRHGQFEGPVG